MENSSCATANASLQLQKPNPKPWLFPLLSEEFLDAIKYGNVNGLLDMFTNGRVDKTQSYVSLFVFISMVSCENSNVGCEEKVTFSEINKRAFTCYNSKLKPTQKPNYIQPESAHLLRFQ